MSSLTGSDLEVDEMLEQKIELNRLREAREKKIKMSVDRKKDSKSSGRSKLLWSNILP